MEVIEKQYLRTTTPQRVGVDDDRSRTMYSATKVVWYVLSVIEVLLLFRVVLKLLGANTGAGFTQFIYGLSQPLVAPFRYVVGSPSIAGHTLEWTTLLAMLVYWVIAWGIVRLIVLPRPVTNSEARHRITEQDVA